jgi:hypothetical protein
VLTAAHHARRKWSARPALDGESAQKGAGGQDELDLTPYICALSAHSLPFLCKIQKLEFGNRESLKGRYDLDIDRHERAAEEISDLREEGFG